MGLSHRDYILACAMAGGRQALFDEVWAVNAMGGIIDCDKIFMMDGASYLINDTKHTHDDCSGYEGWLRSAKVPIMTAFPEADICPTAVQYPLQQVLEKVPYPYLNNTVAYATAYAVAEGYNEISFFGCDFTYPDKHAAESGRGCVEFLIGIAVGRGVKINVADSSSLLDSCAEDKFYGYNGRVSLVPDDNGAVRVVIKEI
jgi:hypothetical protein